MIAPWKMVPLGEELQRSQETITINPEKEYKEITVKLWGKGVILRRITTGSEISTQWRFVARKDQFICSRIDARNGAMGIIPESLDGGVVTNDFPTFNLNREKILPQYLGWLCRTASFVDECIRSSEGTTNRVRLKEKKFLSLKISLPPLPEQRRIVAKIEQIAAKIQEAQSIGLETNEEINQIYLSAFSKCMDDRNNSWIREKVEDIIQNMDAGWSPQCEDLPAKGDDWGILKTTAVQWRKFLPRENKSLPSSLQPRPLLVVKEGDILVTRAGPLKRVGVVAAVHRNESRLMISDKIIRIRPNQRKILPRFLELSLSSPFSQDYIKQKKTGLANAQVNISQTILRMTPISYPSLSEQTKIIKELDSLNLKVEKLKKFFSGKKTELNCLLPTILDRAFKGEL